MLLNPYRTTLDLVPGTRLLTQSFGLEGAIIQDPDCLERKWRICNVYGPIRGRVLGGIRVKLEDEKGFVTFCNQRDLELLLGLGKPGAWCPWTNKEYPELGSVDFFGLHMDTEDLNDDMLDRELLLRDELMKHNVTLLPSYQIDLPRRLHVDNGMDYEDLMVFLEDCDPVTRMGPDMRLETVTNRWRRAERTKLTWSRV